MFDLKNKDLIWNACDLIWILFEIVWFDLKSFQITHFYIILHCYCEWSTSDDDHALYWLHCPSLTVLWFCPSLTGTIASLFNSILGSHYVNWTFSKKLALWWNWFVIWFDLDLKWFGFDLVICDLIFDLRFSCLPMIYDFYSWFDLWFAHHWYHLRPPTASPSQDCQCFRFLTPTEHRNRYYLSNG